MAIKNNGFDDTVLILENMDQADESSWLQTLSLARSLQEYNNLLIIGSCDSEHEEAKEYLDFLEAENIGKQITLDKLDEQDAIGFVREAFGNKNVDKEFISELHKKTDGNRVFMKDILRTLYQVKPN